MSMSTSATGKGKDELVVRGGGGVGEVEESAEYSARRSIECERLTGEEKSYLYLDTSRRETPLLSP